MTKYVFIVFFSSIFLLGTAQADIHPYKHCGIGAMLFPKIPVGAILSNIIWDLGTTAISSKISSEDICEGEVESQVAQFIFNSYAELEEDTVSGEGEYLTTALNIYGCETSTHGLIADDLKTNFVLSLKAEDYAAKTKLDKAESYYNYMNHIVQNKYAKSCQI